MITRAQHQSQLDYDIYRSGRLTPSQVQLQVARLLAAGAVRAGLARGGEPQPVGAVAAPPGSTTVKVAP